MGKAELLWLLLFFKLKVKKHWLHFKVLAEQEIHQEGCEKQPSGSELHFFLFWLCLTVCGILVPRMGIEPGPPALEAWSLNHWMAREVPQSCIFK